MHRSRNTLSLLLAAALVPDAVDRIAAEWSWDFDAVRDFSDGRFLPGALKYGGLAPFAALNAGTDMLLIGPTKVPRFVRAAYAAAGRRDAVRAVPSIDSAELARWLNEP